MTAEIRPIEVQATNEMCGCNGCHAKNYRSSVFLNEKIVDVLFNVTIGYQTAHLCKNCLTRLGTAVALVIGE